MTADSLKSASITSLDAVASSGSPIAIPSAGVGSPVTQKVARDFVTPTTGGLGDTTSKYKVVRLPTNCRVTRVSIIADGQLDSNASPTLTMDAGAYYSDSTTDGTPVANQGTVVSGQVAAFISAAAIGKGTAASPETVTSDNTWTAAKKQKMLWDALGLSKDPGGMFDVVVAVHAAAATAVASPFEVVVEFNMP